MTQHTPNVIVHPNGALIGKCGACDVASFGASRITPCDTHKRAEGSHAQHTPGPWTAHNFGDDSWEILTATTIVAEVQDNLSSPGNSEANAALIAAAPAMYEALKAVESEITRLERISKQAFSIDEVHPAVGRVADATRAAIAAAEGK